MTWWLLKYCSIYLLVQANCCRSFFISIATWHTKVNLASHNQIIELFVDYLVVRLTLFFLLPIFLEFSSCTYLSVGVLRLLLCLSPSQWRACTRLWETLIVQTLSPLWRVRLHSRHPVLRRVPVDSATVTPPFCPLVSSMVRHTDTSNITETEKKMCYDLQQVI